MFEFEPGLILWTSVSFGIMVFLLYRSVLPPFVAFLNKRERQIADQIAQAAEDRKLAEEALSAQQAELIMVRKKADQLLDLAKLDGEKQKKIIVGQAEKQAAGILQQARQDLVTEKEKILSTVKTEVAEYLAAAAGKLMRRSYSLSEHRQLVEESLKEVQDERN